MEHTATPQKALKATDAEVLKRKDKHLLSLTMKPGRPSKENPNRVGPLQSEVLALIAAEPQGAHGIGIARKLRSYFDSDLPDAQVYVALRRMEARGLIELVNEGDTNQNSPSEQNRQRGRARKLYALTMSGKRALAGSATSNSMSEPDRAAKNRRAGHGNQKGAGLPA